jgi:hypothetical protein
MTSRFCFQVFMALETHSVEGHSNFDFNTINAFPIIPCITS